MKLKKLSLLAVASLATVALAACGGGSSSSSTTASSSSSSSDDFSAVMITDTGGVDDKSFNQGAWEGLQEWGKANGGKTKGAGIDYLISSSESDFVTNLNTAVLNDFKMIYGIGFKLEKAVEEVAKANPDAHFAVIDSTVELPNVASVNYKDQEGAFLAGIAAGLTTKTNKVGFIGGMHSTAIDKFEAGFVAGVKAVNSSAEIDIQYTESFVDAAKAKSLAEAMYASNVDVVYAAAGGAGLGVFAAAKTIVEADASKNIWVIGVDQDQSDEGKVNDSRNVTLASTLKGIKTAIMRFSDDAAKGNYHGGEKVTYGLAEDGVGITDGQLTADVKAKIAEYKQAIIDGKQEVPVKP